MFEIIIFRYEVEILWIQNCSSSDRVTFSLQSSDMSHKKDSHQMLKHDTWRLCLINYSVSKENQQKKESENVQENTDNQKTAQQKCCDNNQHKKDKETAEVE